jgi:hypothetical protein
MPRLAFDLETINTEIARCDTLAKQNSELLAKSLTDNRGLTAYLVRDFTEYSTRANVLASLKVLFEKYDGDKKLVAQQVLRELTFPLASIGDYNINELKAWASISMDFNMADF